MDRIRSGLPFIFTLIALCGSVSLQAQSHSRCGPSPVPLSNDCADACLVCDLNGVSARTTHTQVGQVPAGYCTQVAHSMQWLAFIAGSTNLSLNVSVSGCNQNNGVEMGIYASDDCQSFRLVSNCNTNMFNNQTWSFTNTEELKPGCIYYLVFDGNGPNSCNVLFTVTAGSTAAPIPNTTGKISGKTLVCRGEQVEYTIPPIFGACSYEWRVENGTILASQDNKVQVLWDNPGMGKVCVKGVNECQAGNEVCLDVEIGEESPYVELGPYYVCFGGSYKYNNLFLTAGTWNYFFKNRFGCDSNITVVVDELELLESWIDTSLCYPDTLKIANRSFDSTGLYKVVLKSKVSPFCDSTLFINLSYSELLAIARKSGDISCQDSTILLHSDSSRIPANASIRYIWTNSSGDTIGLRPSVSVSQSGNYKLTLIHRIDSLKFCISSQTITVSGSRKTPDLYLLDSLLYCPGDTIFFNNIPVGDRNQSNAPYSIHSGFPCTPQNQIDSAYFILLQDSLLYLKASNGSCVDVIALPFQTRAIDRLLFNDIEQCEGSTLDLNSLSYVREGSGMGGPLFYACNPPDSTCLITNPFLQLQRDTQFFVLPDQARCPETRSFKVKVNPIPTAAFTLPQSDYCQGDTIKIKLPAHGPATTIWVSQDGLETQLPQGTTDYAWPDASTGIHQLCLRTEALGCSDTFCLDYQVHPMPNLPLLNCESTDSTILFNWNAFTGENYRVETLLGGSYTTLTDSSVLFTGLNRGQVIRIRVYVSNAYCRELFTEIECQSKSCPTIDFKIDPVDTICLTAVSPSIVLSANANPNLPGGIIYWRGSGIQDSLSGRFDPGLAGPGNHRIFALLDLNGCRYFDFTTAVIRENPISAFLLDSVVCQDSSILIRFNGSRADSSLFQWNFDGGLISVLIPDREIEIKWRQPGKKRLFLKLNTYKCSDESFREIEVLAPLPKPQVFCETTDSTILFHWNKINRVKQYKIDILDGNTGQWVSDTSYLVKKRFFNDSSRIRLSLEDEGPCSDVASDLILCQSPDCPPRNIVADTALQFCFGQNNSIDLSAFVRDILPQQGWTGPGLNGNVLNTASLLPGDYFLIWNGADFGCDYRDTIRMRIDPNPEIRQMTIIPIPCDPDQATGQVDFTEISSPNPPVQLSVNGSAYLNQNNFPGLSAGTYVFSLRDAKGCLSDTSIVFRQPEIPDIELGPDQHILKGTAIQLSALLSGNVSQFVWQSPQSLSCNNCLNPSLIPEKDLLIFGMVTSQDGCTDLDSIRITLFENNVYAPNVFSPNGDQVNDAFTLFGSEGMIRSLEIFDRWGNRVFIGQHFPLNLPERGWDGRTNGEYNLPGVYVFTAEVEFESGLVQSLSGSLTLLR